MNVRIMYASKQMMKEISFTRKNYKLTEEPGNAKNPPAIQKMIAGVFNSIKTRKGFDKLDRRNRPSGPLIMLLLLPERDR